MHVHFTKPRSSIKTKLEKSIVKKKYINVVKSKIQLQKTNCTVCFFFKKIKIG